MEKTEYPESEYQRLFDAVGDAGGLPLHEELQRIIKIVHEDFPDSASSSTLEWVRMEDSNLPLEKPILARHKFGVEGIQFWGGSWRFWYTGKPVDSEVLSTITHFLIVDAKSHQ